MGGAMETDGAVDGDAMEVGCLMNDKSDENDEKPVGGAERLDALVNESKKRAVGDDTMSVIEFLQRGIQIAVEVAEKGSSTNQRIVELERWIGDLEERIEDLEDA